MSPFKSKSQMRRFAELVKEGKITQEKYEEWMKETKNTHSLPERSSTNKIKTVKKIKTI